MKRFWAVAVCATAIAGVSACERSQAPTTETSPQESSVPDAPDQTAAIQTPISEDAPTPQTPATAGAPAFAVLYPGGSVEGEPVLAAGPGGPGGLVTYLTDADPETVIAFHRARAEAAGLASVMAMNQGEARAYGAARDQDNLQVVASPTPEGRTSVQLSWSATG
jgi:hypothetical protein